MIPTMPSINDAGKEKIISSAASDARGLPQPGLQRKITTKVTQPVARMVADKLPRRDSFVGALSGLSVFIFYSNLSIHKIFSIK